MAPLHFVHEPAADVAPGNGQVWPGILVVDDDIDCRDEYCSTLADLDRTHRAAGSAEEALRIIADDPSIGIVLTDIRMPGMSGITLLGEIQARFHRRPLVAIVVTGHASMDLAVRSIRLDVVDFLVKPVGRAEYIAALERASRNWAIQKSILIQSHIVNLGREVSRISALIDFQTPNTETSPPDSLFSHRAATDGHSDPYRAFIASMLGARRGREKFFPADLFADPAWDIMLELAAAHLDGRSVTITAACIAAAVPTTTALRCIKTMTGAGMLVRRPDVDDRRRVNIELSDEMINLMQRYLETLAAAPDHDIII